MAGPNQTDATLKPLRPSQYTVNGNLTALTPSELLAKAARSMASLTITVGGSATENDELTVNIVSNLLPGGKVTVTVVVDSNDSLTVLAQKLSKELADNATLQSFGVVAYSVDAVATVKWPGLIGNTVTCTTSLSGGATATLTRSNSGSFSGGAGPVIPFSNFNFVFNGQVIQFEAGKPQEITQGLATSLVADNAPVY